MILSHLVLPILLAVYVHRVRQILDFTILGLLLVQGLLSIVPPSKVYFFSQISCVKIAAAYVITKMLF